VAGLFRCAVVAVVLVVTTACSASAPNPVAGPGPATVATPTSPESVARADSVIATATAPRVAIYRTPAEGSEPDRSLSNPTVSGGPLVFLAAEPPGTSAWLHVYLPTRPNGSSGWVHLADVSLSRTDLSLHINLTSHRLEFRRGANVALAAPVGVGTTDTPTPGGLYYITELLQPPDPNGAYGPFAYGLSGFSDRLQTFNGGDAVIGIHGTNQPEAVGHDVSHGCLRVTNDVIRQLVDLLPLGTPVSIEA
jgi:lipoprotein-anchoring transpeptidase ErfK/SrfK